MRRSLILSVLCSIIVCGISVSQQPNEKLNLSHTTSFVAFPQDCNANPPMVFGGKILSEMDRTAAITARRFLYNSKNTKDAVTVAINNVVFKKSAEVKDLIFISGNITKVGEKSISIEVIVERENREDFSRELLVVGEFVFCSYDLAAKKAVPHGLSLK